MPSCDNELLEVREAVFGNESKRIVGLKGELSEMRQVIHGDGKELGLFQRVNIMWRVHVWVLCVLSGAAGSGLTLLIQKLQGP